MEVGGPFCKNCGEQLVDVAFCTSCAAPTGQQVTTPSCGMCGAELERGTAFCTNCGRKVDATPGPVPGSWRSSPAAPAGLVLWLALGGVVVVVLLGAVWLFTSRSTGQDAIQRSEDIASVQPASSELDDDTNTARVSDETLRSVDDETATTPAPATSTAPDSTSTSMTILFGSRDALYGRYVAVLWSGFVSNSPPQDANEPLEAQLANYQAQFGPDVIAIDSDQFRSLRDGTVAVAYDGGFSSARSAKRWCRDNGFPGTQDCFGVVLSDDYTPDQRGDLIRTYDL